VKIPWFRNGEALARMLVLQCCLFLGFGAGSALGGAKIGPLIGLIVGAWITSHMKLGKPPNTSVFRHWEMWAGVAAFLTFLWTGNWVGAKFGHELIGIAIGGLIAVTIVDRTEYYVENRYFPPPLDQTIHPVQ